MHNLKTILHKSEAKTYCIALVLLLLPTSLGRPLVNMLGARIHRTAHVGFSWVYASTLCLGENARIGHFNSIRVRRLIIGNSSAISTLNLISGSFSVVLHELAEIGARNVITRAEVAREIGSASLHLGRRSKITAGHKLDILRTIFIGEDSILAGQGSQMWTHGYVHEPAGRRFRVDGAIAIGSNVYIGSACIFNPGVRIVDDVAVGSHCCISKDLLTPGTYVNQPLRYIERTSNENKEGLDPVKIEGLTEPVYIKKKPFSERQT